MQSWHHLENHWIRWVGTATCYGWNDKIDGISILSSSIWWICSTMLIDVDEAMIIVFVHHLYPHDVTLSDIPFILKQLSMHYIRTELCSIFLSKLHSLYNSCLETPGTKLIQINTRRAPLVSLHLRERLRSPPVFSEIRVVRSLVFCGMFCRSLFVLLYFFFWPVCFLSFDLRILITPFDIFKLSLCQSSSILPITYL